MKLKNKDATSRIAQLHKKLARKPIAYSVTIVFVILVICSIGECVRASFYMNHLNDYKNSAKIQHINEDIDRINRAVTRAPSAYFCDITSENLLDEFNSAYLKAGSEDSEPGAIIEHIRQDFTDIGPVPEFTTIFSILPRPSKAIEQSKQAKEAYLILQDLIKIDERSEYCQSLQEILGRTYFIESIRKPEGVSALLPGQIENFQINLSQAQEALDTLPAIDNSIEVHAGLRRAYSSLSLILKGDENNYVMFSRAVEEQYTEIGSLLESLRSKNQDLQDIPAQLALAIVDLQ